MKALLVAVLLIVQTPPNLAELQSRVARYWDLLIQQDKAGALEFVARDSRNSFIKRREPSIRSWKLVGISHQADGPATVTLELERAFPGVEGYHRVGLVETWVVEDSEWRVRVQSENAESTLKAYRGPSGAGPKPQAGVLKVAPETLRIHFLDRRRRGGVRVANGLDQTLQVLRVDFDRRIFDLAESPQQIPPGEYGLFALRYTGDEIGKDRTSHMTIVVGHPEGEQVFQVPVVYNYLSPAARGLFGLTPEEAEKLKPGDKLTPKLKPPAPPREPPAGNPKPPHR